MFTFRSQKILVRSTYLLNVVELDRLIRLVCKQALSFLEAAVSLRVLWLTNRFKPSFECFQKEKRKIKVL